MSRYIRPLSIALSICLLALSAVPVLAAVPGNDDIGSPIVIGSIPFSNNQDTSEATTGGTDPDCDGTGPTVWYAYSAAETTRLEANTFGSDYDTVLVVGTPDGAGGIDFLTCNDQAAGTDQSRVRFDAEAGNTYLFMIGAWSGAPNGGELVFNLHEAPPLVPLELSISVNPTGSFDRNGMATISGVVTCSGGEFVYLDGYLSQQVGRFTINGYGWDFVECSPDGTSFQMDVTGATGKFGGGPATAWVYAETWNDEDYTYDFVQTTVRLRK